MVVNIDNKLDEDVLRRSPVSQIPFVGPDNRQGARMVGEVPGASSCKPGDEVAILEGVPTAFNATAAPARLRRRHEGGRA